MIPHLLLGLVSKDRVIDFQGFIGSIVPVEGHNLGIDFIDLLIYSFFFEDRSFLLVELHQLLFQVSNLLLLIIQFVIVGIDYTTEYIFYRFEIVNF